MFTVFIGPLLMTLKFSSSSQPLRDMGLSRECLRSVNKTGLYDGRFKLDAKSRNCISKCGRELKFITGTTYEAKARREEEGDGRVIYLLFQSAKNDRCAVRHPAAAFARISLTPRERARARAIYL